MSIKNLLFRFQVKQPQMNSFKSVNVSLRITTLDTIITLTRKYHKLTRHLNTDERKHGQANTS